MNVISIIAAFLISSAPIEEASPKVTAEFGKGVVITASDNSYSLNIRGRIQPRIQLAYDTESKEAETQFQIRRARLLFQGHVLSPNFKYYFQLGFSNGDTEPDLRLPLRDAYVTWSGSNQAQIRAGQMKVPFSRQRVISSSALQMVDRSIVNAELSLDRDVGVQIFSEDVANLGGILGYQVGIFGGDGRNRVAETPGLLYVARLQVRPMGEFNDYVEADHDRRAFPKLALGLGAGYNQGSNRTKSTLDKTTLSTTDFIHAEADLIWKWYGWSVQSEVVYRQALQNRVLLTDGKTVNARSGIGGMIQSGIMLTDNLEPVARLGMIRPLGESSIEIQNEYGAGLNWYFHRHDLKLQTDYFYLTGKNQTTGNHQGRIQMQLFF